MLLLMVKLRISLIHSHFYTWISCNVNGTGFCMLETGLVRAKNAVMQCAKNIGLYSIAGIMFAVVGHNLMYMDVSGYMALFLFGRLQTNLNLLKVIIPLVQFGGFKLFSVLLLNQLSVVL